MNKPRTIQPLYRKVPLQNPPSDFAYWQTQPYHLRLATLEQIRREYHHGQYDTASKVQKVYSIVKR